MYRAPLTPWRRLRARSLFVAILVLAGGPAGVEGAGGGAATIAYDRTPGAVVVRFTEVPGELAEADGGPVLTVYGDGRATVRYPPYMRRAGTYTVRLARPEVDALVASLADKGLVELDAAREQQSLRAAEASRAAAAGAGDAALVAVTDEATTIVDLTLERYDPADGPPLTDVRQRIVWHGLREDAARHGRLGAVGGLDGARRELLDLMERVHDGAR